MATFIMLSTLGPDGMATLKSNPRRLLEVNSEVAEMGAQVTAQWALAGQYDFCTVLEAPDLETVAKVAVALGARGTLKTQTLPAMPVEHFLAVLEAGN
ncbi:MAG: GYD domain-containing protein [Actinobacteria bacterium]|nr:GYD domain-containing protein [Actinomycetota bacterium]MCL5447012.1 GYD domain-containing protein [Actinomycetota bacterium]